jgi:hypothetical protein
MMKNYMFTMCSIGGVLFGNAHCAELPNLSKATMQTKKEYERDPSRWSIMIGPALLAMPALVGAAVLGCKLYAPYALLQWLGATQLQGLFMSLIGNLGFDRTRYYWLTKNMNPEQKKKFDRDYYLLESAILMFIAGSGYCLYGMTREYFDKTYEIGVGAESKK